MIILIDVELHDLSNKLWLFALIAETAIPITKFNATFPNHLFCIAPSLIQSQLGVVKVPRLVRRPRGLLVPPGAWGRDGGFPTDSEPEPAGRIR